MQYSILIPESANGIVQIKEMKAMPSGDKQLQQTQQQQTNVASSTAAATLAKSETTTTTVTSTTTSTTENKRYSNSISLITILPLFR